MPSRAHQIDRVIDAVRSSIWAMHEPKLREIEAFLELRATQDWDDYQSVHRAFVPREGLEIFRDEEGRRVDVDGIRYMRVFGVMIPRANLLSRFSGGTSTSQFMDDLRVAANDDRVRTIFVHVDSPGGEAGLIAEAAELMREVRMKKRIVVAAEGMMASGALWLGTAGTVVYATRGTAVGSQGAYTIHTEYSKARKDVGVTDTVIRSGENKALANSVEELTKAARAKIQAQLDDLNALFVSDMAKNRKVTEQFVLDRFGQGDMFSAAEALERNMIDGISAVEEVIERERRQYANVNKSPIVIGASNNGRRTMEISPRVKAALFVANYVGSDASDAECVAALRVLCGQAKVKMEDQSEDELVSLIQGPGQKAEESTATETAAETATGVDANGREYIAAVAEPLRTLQTGQQGAERIRVLEITSIGRTLNVSSDAVMKEIEAGTSVEDARTKFAKIAEDAAQAVAIVPGDASADKIVTGVAAAMMDRAGFGHILTDEERSYGASLVGHSLIDMARATLVTFGMRPSGDRETDARAFLAMGTLAGGGKTKFVTNGSGEVTRFMVSEPSVNRRGDHPDALSNLMGRMLDFRPPQAEITYRSYARQLPDLPDFRPKTFLETAAFQELDHRGEDDKHQQLKFQSNLRSTIEVHKYGNKVALTVEMVIDDDIGTFAQQLETLRDAADYTLDNKCRTLLASNPVMIDGTTLFHANRGNLISGAPGVGAPSATTAAEHRRVHRLIKGFGTTRPMNLPPRTALVPAQHEEKALQTFLVAVQDAKVANTDGNINTVRGTIAPVVDSMLDDFSVDIWYTFSDTRQAPIAYAFLRGSGGSAGTRTTWTDPDTGSRYIAVDVVLGVAPFSPRGSVRNNGQ